MIIKTTGFKYTVFNDTVAIDIMSKTEISQEESQRIVREFFENFKILKSTLITPDDASRVLGVKPKTPIVEEGVKEKEVPEAVKKHEVPRKGLGVKPKTQGIEEDVKKHEEQKPAEAVRRNESLEQKWKIIGPKLKDGFTQKDYIKALMEAGYKYSEKSWGSILTQQFGGLKKSGKIEEIPGSRPKRYKKIKDKDVLDTFWR